MTRACAWVLNLDAEEELADPSYTPSAAVRSRMRVIRDRLAASLPAGDVVLDRQEDCAARGLAGRAWCPTPFALGRLARASAQLPEAPPVEVLTRVNERGFSYAIERLPGAAVVRTEDEAVRALRRPGRWLAKRGLTFAGRGQRRIDPDTLGEPDRAWIRASLRRGALYIEPRVDLELEVSLHGHLFAGGALRRGRATVQEMTSRGHWRSSRLARPHELSAEERARLHAAYDRTVAALRHAGYFGPFGIDAFRGRLPGHPDLFVHALSELNARYTMGWPVGMGSWRAPRGAGEGVA